MIGVIERIKNNVLLKCSTLNDNVISDSLNNIIYTDLYHFAEDLISMLNGINIQINEDQIRDDSNRLIKDLIVKKVKRKLFIDSLALQITNDAFIEDYVNKNITLEKLKSDYIKELKENENSNQLNMTEDLNLNEIFEKIYLYINKNVISIINENEILSNNVNKLVGKIKEDLEQHLEELMNETNEKYLDILIKELEEVMDIKEEENNKGDSNMFERIDNFEETKVPEFETVEKEPNKFDKYDDMTLFNKLLLSLNTKEENLARIEKSQEKKKEEINAHLTEANKNIELNIERENALSQRRVELNSKEIELNSKLSEAEVIFLNMKPLIKGLNNIKASDEGGSKDE